MDLKDIDLIPIVDKNKIVVKVKPKSEILKTNKFNFKLGLKSVPVVIMAGGRGKRLSPLTDKVPKPMLKLGSKPIIEHNIDNLISFGIRNIYISVNYLSEQIKDYFGNGSEKGKATKEQGKKYFFNYELGYLELEEEQFAIVKKQDYVK